jgi:hypothetical protein
MKQPETMIHMFDLKLTKMLHFLTLTYQSGKKKKKIVPVHTMNTYGEVEVQVHSFLTSNTRKS